MPFRMSLKKLIRRDPVANLRERAAELQARIPAPKPSVETTAPTHVEQVARAGTSHDVLAASGIDHRDGTVSYADASGGVSRQPMARFIAFNAMQMHLRVQAEIDRQRADAYALPADEYAAWETRVRRELRADAVSALTLNPQRAFKAEEARRSGAEPISPALRAGFDAELVALLPKWQAARDAYNLTCQRQGLVEDAARVDGRPGPAPVGSGPDWQEWFAQSQAWRERTGVKDAEAASGEALDELFEIENRIADLSAASLAGLRLKALVAQRYDDLDVERPDGFDEGLTRDLLAFTADADVDWRNPPPGFMASPAIEPTSFIAIFSGLRIELERLHGIAQAEYACRAASLSNSRNADETRGRLSAIREDVFLPALTAAVDPDSAEAAALAALNRAPHDDADLLRLGRQFDALIAKRQPIEQEHDRIEEIWASTGPERPACLVLRESDRAFRLLRRNVLIGEMEGQNIRFVDIDAIQGRRFSRGVSRPTVPEDGLPADAHTIEESQPWPEAQARADEIVAAWDAWQEQIDRHNVESGMQAAEERLDAIDAQILALVDRIADLPATTAEGMRLKLRASALYVEEHNGDFPNGRLLNSLLRDAKVETPPQADRKEPPPAPASLDLQDASIQQLARLYDHVSSIAQIASTAVNAPMGWDDRRLNLNSIGRLLEAEHCRLDELAERVVAEIRERRPADGIDGEDRLATIVKRQMEVFSAIDDQEVAAEIRAAWPVLSA